MMRTTLLAMMWSIQAAIPGMIADMVEVKRRESLLVFSTAFASGHFLARPRVL